MKRFSETTQETKIEEPENKIDAKEKANDPVEDILQETVKKVEKVVEKKDVTVVVSSLNVRKRPNADAEIIKIVHSGDILPDCVNNGEWTEVPSLNGYVMTKFVSPVKKG